MSIGYAVAVLATIGCLIGSITSFVEGAILPGIICLAFVLICGCGGGITAYKNQ